MSSVALTPKRKEKLGKDLTANLSTAISLRSERVAVWKEAIDRYEAKSIPKNVPFYGASSLHPPIIALTFDSIEARVMNALWADTKIVNGEPLTEEVIPGLTDPVTGDEITWRTVAELLEEYMLYEISPAGDVALRGATEDFFKEMGLFGTGHMKVVWDTQIATDITEGGERIDHTIRDNVRIIVPSIEDIFLPANYPDLERVPWITQRYTLRASELVHRITSLGWSKEAVSDFLTEHSKDYARQTELQEQSDNIEGMWSTANTIPGEYAMAETWMRYDLDDKGTEMRIVVDHSFDDPNCIFRIIAWPYAHGRLPFIKADYIKRRNRYYGMGIPERLRDLDEGISTTINQMVDNVTNANTRIWSVDENSKAMQALDRIWPGKKIPRSSPDEIVPLQMGEVYPSLFEQYNILTQLTEKVSKLTDYNLGRESQAMGRQSTATATMALLQESGQYWDTITRAVRNANNEVIQQWFDLIVQYKPFDRIRQVLGSKAEILIAALSLPFGDLRKRVAIRISFSSTAATKEIARQEEMSKLQMMQQFYEKAGQTAMARFSPQMPLPVVAYIDAAMEDMELRVKKALETFGDAYTSTTVPSWKRIMNATPPVPGPGFQYQLAQSQASMAAGALGLPGMGNPGGAPGGEGPEAGAGSPPGNGNNPNPPNPDQGSPGPPTP